MSKKNEESLNAIPPTYFLHPQTLHLSDNRTPIARQGREKEDPSKRKANNRSKCVSLRCFKRSTALDQTTFMERRRFQSGADHKHELARKEQERTKKTVVVLSTSGTCPQPRDWMSVGWTILVCER